MATLALGVAGAMAGSAISTTATFLGMSYASIGWAAGSALGSYLFAPDAPDSEGPRLGDLKVNSPAYGAPIPRCWGRFRMAGQIIDSTRIKETKHEEDVGGKGGGGGGTRTTYTYSITFAVSLCEGPIAGVRKLWANSELIWSRDPNDDGETLSSGLDNVKEYYGTETQTPDPTLESIHGVGETPAYRGIAYLVFTDLELEKFGNRPPVIEAEVVADGSLTNIGVSPKYTTFYGFNDPNSDNPGSRMFDPSSDNNSELKNGVFSYYVRNTGNSFMSKVSFDMDGNFKGFDAAPSTENLPSNKVYFDDSYVVVSIYDGLTGDSKVEVYELSGEGPYLVREFSPIGPTASVVATVSDGDLWIIRQDDYAADPVIEKYRGLTGGLQDSTTFNFDSRIKPTSLSVDRTYVVPDGDDFWVVRSGGPFPKVFRFELEFGDYVLKESVGTNDIPSLSGMFDSIGAASNGVLGLATAQNMIFLYAGGLINSDSVFLSDIVGDICESSSIRLEDVDTSELIDEVPGYALTRIMNSRAAIEPLQSVYFFDCIESDWRIKWVKRGRQPAIEIDESELAARGSQSDDVPRLTSVRQQELELPAKIYLSHLDPASDYQINTQTSKRIITDNAKTISKDLSIVESPDKIAQATEILLYNLWVERTTFMFSIPSKYEWLDPCDVVSINHQNSTVTCRITRIKNGPALEVEAVAEDPTTYQSSTKGTSLYYTKQRIRSIGDTVLRVMDLPPLRDLDNTPTLYLAANGAKSNWSGSTVYSSGTYSGSYTRLKTVEAPSIMGTMIMPLRPSSPDVIDKQSRVKIALKHGSIHSISDDEFKSGTSNFAAVTYVPNNSRSANIVPDYHDYLWEIIQFRDVEVDDYDGSFIISHIARGLKGTEKGILPPDDSTLDLTSWFVMLDLNSTRRLQLDLDDIGKDLHFKGVTFGQRIQSVDPTSLFYTGQSLMPFTVCHLKMERQAIIPLPQVKLTWIRRNRIGGDWRNGVDVPMSESEEKYLVEIYRGGLMLQSEFVTSPEIQISINDYEFYPNERYSAVVYQYSESVGYGPGATLVIQEKQL
ncbi:MAG: phage tail protein [Actinobacteria bacterium]|nr:phage tail protein [Actinomycetota bacterium]